MPVGVPKVFYSPDPEEETGQWMDLYNCLFRLRYLFLCNDLKEELTNQLIGILLYLNFDQENLSTIYVFINSLGGDMVAGLGLVDMMGYVRADVSTVCIGTAASMASFVLMGGFPGKRVAMKNCRTMLHQPAGENRGQGTIVHREAEEMVRLRTAVVDMYVDVRRFAYEH